LTDDGQGIYTYNEKGELASVEDAVNETITRYEDDKTSVYSTDNSNLLYEYKTTEDGFRFERHPQADGEVSQWIAEHYQDTDYENGVSQKTIAFNGSNIATIKETTDKLGRLSQTNIIKPNNSSVLKKNFQYKDLSVNRTTEQVSRIDYTFGNGSTFNENYTYNNYGQIETITDSAGNVKRYKYDGFGQLIREDDPVKNKTILYSYSEGNLTKKQEYAYTTADTVGTCTNEISYTYGDNNRKDLLTSYNGQSITYDAIGNPTSYKGITLEWEKGRQLKTYDRGSLIIDYKYDVNGLRTEKKIGNTEHKYTYVNGQLYAYEVNGQQMFFSYDDNGSPLSFTYNGAVYHYQTNLQGDVIGIVNNSGTKVVSYSYDAWGYPTGSVPSSGIGYYNPLRYRGYVFDYETGWYYLQSRYYDPNMGRFLNSDDPTMVVFIMQPLGANLGAYCNNNPIMNVDIYGLWAEDYPGFKWTSKGFNLNVHRNFLSKSFCLKYAKDIIRLRGKKYWWGKGYKDMGEYRIAKELWFHALVYYVGPSIKGIFNKIGIPNGVVDKLMDRAGYMQINNNDWRVDFYTKAWTMSFLIETFVYLKLKYFPYF